MSSSKMNWPHTSQHTLMNRVDNKGAYTQQELDRIQITLNKVLSSEYISTRPGAGGSRVSYLEGWKALNLANEVFGFNGWSSELKSTTVDYLDEIQGRYSIGLSTVVRVTLKDGSFHEDIGYGFIDNAKSKAAAFEKCKKEAFTDGVKRCLRCFGNVLGNCLYDKNLLVKLRNANKENSALNDEDIFQGSDLLKLAKQRTNKVSIASVSNEKFQKNYEKHQSENNNTKEPEPVAIPSVNPLLPTPISNSKPLNSPEEDIYDEEAFLFSDDIEGDKLDDYEMNIIMGNNHESKENQPPNESHVVPALFVSAKSAELMKKTPTSNSISQFDPKFISPNIRRTLDPTKSVPVKRAENSYSQTPSKPTKRMIGMPPSYKPAMKKLKDNTTAEPLTGT